MFEQRALGAEHRIRQLEQTLEARNNSTRVLDLENQKERLLGDLEAERRQHEAALAENDYKIEELQRVSESFIFLCDTHELDCFSDLPSTIGLANCRVRHAS